MTVTSCNFLSVTLTSVTLTKMVQFERLLFSVVSILLLILLLRRARRMRSLITYLGFEYEVSEDVLVTGSLITHRRRTLRERAALRRQALGLPSTPGMV